MILSEQHRIRSCNNRELFHEIDTFCYLVKNLSNSVNYLVKQCYRIHTKLKTGKDLEDWEKTMVNDINDGIQRYNFGRPNKKELRYVDSDNAYIADAYFLSWYLKDKPEYKAVPYATCSQICIQEKCREWKSFYSTLAEYQTNPENFLGRPHAPRYLDPNNGRGTIVITSQNFKLNANNRISMPKFLNGISIRARHNGIRQIRIRTIGDSINITLQYEKKEAEQILSNTVMGIDLGVNNLMAASWNSEMMPVLINGRPLKSINQYFNKTRAVLQEEAKKINGRDMSKKISRLTRKRNRKIKDYMHKASKKIVDFAVATDTGLIVIGKNKGWKQNAKMGKRTNQNFVSIPYNMLIKMISYKARLQGIEVKVVSESYTSGTSYLDGERPTASNYDKSRRIKRGIFISNKGISINADVNAAYQMIKLVSVREIMIKKRERITKIKVA